jgi:hypothetical protein
VGISRKGGNGKLARGRAGYATVLSLAAMVAMAYASSAGMVTAQAAGGAPLDTVTATNGTAGIFSNINISAQSGTAGQNPTGTVSFIVFGGVFSFSGPVTCLSVTGPDNGAGTLLAPTIGVVNFQSNSGFGIITVELIDKGGNGADLFNVSPLGRGALDCSAFPSPAAYPYSGQAVVFDAPPLPTSKDQCKDGGWQGFAQFKNQGDCVSFVENGS